MASKGEEEKKEAANASWWDFASAAVTSVSSTVSKHATAAVEQGAAVIQSAQEDLKEFASTLSSETVEIKEEVKDQLEKVTENFKKSMTKADGGSKPSQHTGNDGGNSLLSLSDNIENMGNLFSQMMPSSAKKVEKSSSAQTFAPGATKLLTMRSSEESYTQDPTNTSYARFADDFKKKYDNGEYKSEILLILNDCESVRKIHSKLVPSQVIEIIFWSRYFFRIGLLEQEEERRRKLLARINQDVQTKEGSRKAKEKSEKSKESVDTKETKKEADLKSVKDKIKRPKGASKNEGQKEKLPSEETEEKIVSRNEEEKNADQPNSQKSSGQSSQGGWVDVEDKQSDKESGKEVTEDADMDLNALVGDLTESKKEDDDCWVWE